MRIEVDPRLKTEGLDAKPHIPKDLPHGAKIARVLDACRWRDAETLRGLAVSEAGLINDEVRRQACWFPQRSRKTIR